MGWSSEGSARPATPANPLSLLVTKDRLRPGLAFLAVWAVYCLVLELLILQQVDSLRLYMSAPQIMLDAGVAVLLLLGIASVWWLCILGIGAGAKAIPWTRPFSVRLSWFLWLVPPFAYLVARLSGAVRAEVFPNGHVNFVVQLVYALGLVVACLLILRSVGFEGLQKFCETRLAPIGWLHLGLGVLCLIMLWGRGVYLFRNYATPGKIVAAHNLPDIYLITVDALRADDTSVYGYHRPTTPSLERFAQRSFTFDHFFANSNFTTPATTTIETGKLPWSHRVFQFGGFLSPSARHENLPAVLREHGYYTAMISSNFVASPFHHGTLESYDAVAFAAPLGVEGFWLRYTNLVGANTQSTLAYSILRRLFKLCEYLDGRMWRGRYFSPADSVFARTRALLERSDISQPRFVWAHVFPPHDPYWPPAAYRKRFSSTDSKRCADITIQNPKKLPSGTSTADVRACYDEMVLYADHAVGGFLDWLEQTGRLERAIVVISSDHGESFEDSWLLHGGPRLHNGLIHVPLLIHLPGQRQGVRVAQLAQQVDLLPTLLDLAGIAAPDWTDGTSLTPALHGQPLPEHYIFSMNLESNRVFERIDKGTLAIMDSEFSFISNLGSEKQALYRYKTDYLEENNVIDSEPEVADRLRDALLGELKNVNESYAAKQRAEE